MAKNGFLGMVLCSCLMVIQSFAAEKPVLIAVDISASMNGLWAEGTKWQAAESSLKTVAKDADKSLLLGVFFFGGTADDCGAAKTVVMPKRYNRSRIRMGFEEEPGGPAPLVAMLDQLVERMPLKAEGADWIVVTDGGPYCDGDLSAAVTRAKNQFPELRISVVGLNLSPEKASNLMPLTQMTGGWGYNVRQGGLNDAMMAICKKIADPDPATERAPTGKVKLKAKRKSEPGARLEIVWEGTPGEFDEIAIFEKGSGSNFRLFDWRKLRVGEPLSLVAPDIAGKYEIRYLSGPSQTVLDKVSLKVMKADASISLPTEAKAGSSVAVTWKGPAGEGDRLALYAENGGPSLVVVVNLEASPVEFPMPSLSGIFEVRYETGTTKQVLAKQSVTLLAPQVSVGAPRQVSLGTLFEVGYQGPASEGDILAIVSPERGGRRHRFERVLTTSGSLQMLAPDKAGTYKVQYISGKDNVVLSEATFRTTNVRSTVKTVESAAAGSELEVEWTGPGGPGDIIGVYGNNQEGILTLIAYSNVGTSSPVTLLAPDYPGIYQVRYVTSQSKLILAETTLKITDVEAELTVLKWVGAGKDFEVKFSGPRNKLDVIALVDYEDPNLPKRIQYKPVGAGSAVYLTAPVKNGLYEVRYLMGKSQRILAKAWIRIRDE